MTSAADLNHRQLALAYVLRLLAERPQTVLDVGSGRGLVLDHLRRAGVPVVGVEADARLGRELGARDQRVVCALAQALPFRNRRFDWVSVRHVLHHLDDVRGVLAEAARVARSGIIVAEPWYDLSLPSQALSLRIERWRKRQHRRLGRIHEENLAAGDLLEALPREARFDIALETVLYPRAIPPAELEAELQHEIAGLEPDALDRDEYHELARRLRSDGATYHGTAILVAKYLGC